MSWMRLSMVMWGNEVRRHEQVEVELGRLGEVTFLRRYTGSVDEWMAPEELGRRIDHGLVEYIRMQLLPLSLNPPKEGVALASWSGKGVLL